MNLLMTMTDRPGTWKLQPAPAFISFCQADVNFIAYSHFTWTFIFQNPNWSGGNFILQLSINRMHNLPPLKNLEKSKDSDYIIPSILHALLIHATRFAITSKIYVGFVAETQVTVDKALRGQGM